MKLYIVGMVAILLTSACGKSAESERISLAKKEVECATREADVVRRVVYALEIQYLDKSNFGGSTPKMSDEEFKIAMQNDIIPARLIDQEDKKNTFIATELWKSKNLFEKIPSKEVPFASISGTRRDNTEQEAAIWKIGKAICLSL